VLELTPVRGTIGSFFDLTVVPVRGSVSHLARMEALKERNAEMEFYCYAGVFLIMVLGFFFRGRH
jgi:hypothetical protein